VWHAGIKVWRLIGKGQSNQPAGSCQHHLARFKVHDPDCQSRIEPDSAIPEDFPAPNRAVEAVFYKDLNLKSDMCRQPK